MKFGSTLIFSLFLLSLSVLVICDDVPGCLYIIYVKTGTVDNADTDSKISVRLGTEAAETASLRNLAAWGGVRGPNYNYFENGNLDIFSGGGTCLRSRICSLILESDGTGTYPGWYVDYVEVLYSEPDTQCQRQKFTIDQWLSVGDEYSLIAVRDNCIWTATPTTITNGTLARPV